MKVIYDYIKMIKIEAPKRKTMIFEVRTNRDNFKLGEIKWSGTWRQYTLQTQLELCKFSRGCLLDIIHFIDQLEETRK